MNKEAQRLKEASDAERKAQARLAELNKRNASIDCGKKAVDEARKRGWHKVR